MKKLDEQHNERMKELYNQSEEARIQYEKSISKANTQIKLAWGAFGVAVASLIATIVALFKTLNILIYSIYGESNYQREEDGSNYRASIYSSCCNWRNLLCHQSYNKW